MTRKKKKLVRGKLVTRKPVGRKPVRRRQEQLDIDGWSKIVPMLRRLSVNFSHCEHDQAPTLRVICHLYALSFAHGAMSALRMERNQMEKEIDPPAHVMIEDLVMGFVAEMMAMHSSPNTSKLKTVN